MAARPRGATRLLHRSWGRWRFAGLEKTFELLGAEVHERERSRFESAAAMGGFLRGVESVLWVIVTAGGQATSNPEDQPRLGNSADRS
jgi:hypothetical protein